MKKRWIRLLCSIAFMSVMTLIPQRMFAIDLGASEMRSAGVSAGVNTTGATLPQYIGSLINLALSILGVILLIYFVYAGIVWMTSAGNEKKIAEAKNIMKNCVVGLVITLSAYTMVAFLEDRIPGGTRIWNSTTEEVAQNAGFAGGVDIEDRIGLYINIVLNLLGVVLLIFFIYAGILWMTAQGDDKQIGKAKDIMKNAVIGLILTLLAYSISSFVINQLSGQGTTRMDYGDSLIGGD